MQNNDSFEETILLLNKERKEPLPIEHLREKLIPFVKAHAYDMTEGNRARFRAALEKGFGLSREELDQEIATPPVQRVTKVKDDFMELVPGSGLFRDYITFTKSSEPPTVFHFFSFLTVLGACLKRQIWIPMGVAGDIFPNQVSILVGPSGRVKKTTACNIALELGLLSGRLWMAGGEKATNEAILDDLADHKQAIGLVFAPELSVLLGRQKYNEGLVTTLTRLWDCPPIFKLATIRRGKKELREVALSLLGASNEAWLVNAIPDDAFTGGFMARVLQIYQKSSPRYFPWPPAPDEVLKKFLVRELAQTEVCRGPVTISEKIKKVFEKRYKAYRDANPTDARLAPFYERLPQHCLRLAMCISVAEKRTRIIKIRQRHMDQAYDILEWVCRYLPKIYSFLGATDVGNDGRKIQELILGHGGRIDRETLVRKMSNRLSSKQLDDRIVTLEQGGLLRQFHSSLLEPGVQRGQVLFELVLPEGEE